jgi:murein DD-endopeptidase MepM/ murein hydrolase activator NlpD
MSDWSFPLRKCDWDLELPQGDHPGAFGAVRKFDIHTGVDLYCDEGTPVYAVEDGEVIAIEEFTGPNAESPWWHETLAVLVKGESGVVGYGEVSIGFVPTIENPPFIKVGELVKRGDLIGWTKQVLKKDKGKPMCMLHLELYLPKTTETVWWRKEGEKANWWKDTKPPCLLDPTEKLLAARRA